MGIRDKKGPYWKQKDGTLILIKDMTDSHLANAIRMMERYAYLKHSEAVSSGYIALCSVNGEMAELSIEQGIYQLEEEGPNPWQYEAYCNLKDEELRRQAHEQTRGL